MMNKLFSLHLIDGRKFLLLLALFVNLQIMKAACKPIDIPSSDTEIQTTAIFVKEGTVSAGMEQLHIILCEKKKINKKSKKKASAISDKRKFKNKQSPPSPNNINKLASAFIRSTNGDTSLLAVSDHDQQIFRPIQPTHKFLLKPENYILILIFLLGIFLNKIYKSHWFSTHRLFPNFNRPPPVWLLRIPAFI